MSHNILNLGKVESINLLDQQIEKGERLFKSGHSTIKKNKGNPIPSRDRDVFESMFNLWVDTTYSILLKIYKNSEYALEFKDKQSSKVTYVSSSWVRDIKYYLQRQLVPKLDYLNVLRDSIDDFKEERVRALESRADLDPWRVICGHLFELDSYFIPEIIDKTGMKVNWRLTKEEDDSHNYRKAAYRPRINAEYDSLSDTDKLRVAFIVASELSGKGYADSLSVNLGKIGWHIEDGYLTPSRADIQELFFPKDSHHDAYVEIRNLFQKAENSIVDDDPYLDSSIFIVLGTLSSSSLNVQLLTYKVPSDFAREMEKFIAQHQTFRLVARKSNEFHDRFIILDNDEYWHLGCSIKDAGNKVFMLSKIEDIANKTALTEHVKNSWSEAQKI
ncbi:MAG: hypothetical protein ACLPX5_01690 [Dissulfurispiraceae bacterium]